MKEDTTNIQWIPFYISSHGFGHMTRCLAIIEKILMNDNYNIYIISGEKQNEFASMYLDKWKHRVKYHNMVTDIGLINQPMSLQVDVEKLHLSLQEFTNNWQELVAGECERLEGFNIPCLVADISPIGALVGKGLGVTSIGISNFTWVEQYEGLGISKEIIDSFRHAYDQVDVFYEYDLSMEMNAISCKKEGVGFVARSIDEGKVREIREKFGKCIFITCGKSAALKKMIVRNYDGHIFTTSGIDIESTGKVVQLPMDTLDTHHYIAASELVIAKAGWGTIGEALIGHVPLVLMEREGVVEDTFSISELVRWGLAISIREEDMGDVDIEYLMDQASLAISRDQLDGVVNGSDGVARRIVFKEYLDK